MNGRRNKVVDVSTVQNRDLDVFVIENNANKNQKVNRNQNLKVREMPKYSAKPFVRS